MLFKQALCLPAPEVLALTEGRMIVALPSLYLSPGLSFFLYPAETSGADLSLEATYRSSFLPDAKTALTLTQNNTVLITHWAKCELCHRLYEQSELLEKLAQLTIWTPEGITARIKQNNIKNLAFLRVYKLPQPLPIEPVPESGAKIGKFLGVASYANITELLPVLDDLTFTKRYTSIKNLEPPEHLEIEALESAIAQFPTHHLSQEEQIGLITLKANIQQFLGWKTAQPATLTDSKLNWIHEIVALGNRSLEQDQNKSNYQAGTDFENIVKKSLRFLGFDLDPNAQGGAGGMDLYCIKPYPMVGECKAGKSIPDSTAEQLYRIGLRHLGKEAYEKGIKLIIGPGQPTKYLQQSAQNSNISIIHPMSLEKLVKLQAKYPGSVDLIKLKEYLRAGQSDAKIDEYIETVIEQLKLRSQIIQAIKELNTYDNSNLSLPFQTCSVVEVRVHHNAKYNPKLDDKAVRDLLIELSSPVAGYLGRTTDDRFYFLRELIVDPI